ncbi:ArsA family ATPase [Halorutilales archaeon Cl-col2-1]
MAEFILYGGKGGVGKTTCAAATALKLSRQGERTLVVSTDPAHSLSDVFETEVPSRPEEILDNLWAVEIDPEEAMSEYREKIEGGMLPDEGREGEDWEKDMGAGTEAGEGTGAGAGMGGGLGGLGGMGGMEGLGDLLGGEEMMGPGSDEAAAMDKFMEYMDSEKWDKIVFDTAPTGHTLRLLKLPEIMDSMVGKVMKVRSQFQGFMDSVKGMFGGDDEPETADFGDLDELKDRIERVRTMLRDPDKTDFRVVMIPEKMAVLETQRLIERLSRFEIPVRTVVINKVMENINDDCDFCRSRWEVQESNIDKANEMFRDLEIQYVPLLEDEVQGIESLETVAEEIEVD